jgi:hypothetical protein
MRRPWFPMFFAVAGLMTLAALATPALAAVTNVTLPRFVTLSRNGTATVRVTVTTDAPDRISVYASIFQARSGSGFGIVTGVDVPAGTSTFDILVTPNNGSFSQGRVDVVVAEGCLNPSPDVFTGCVNVEADNSVVMRGGR